MTVQDFRDRLTTLLAGQIGIYKFSTGATTPAIRIEDGSEPYEEEPEVAGLEVVIVPEVEVAIASFLAGDKRLDLISKIVLKQWDQASTTKAAREILISNLELESVGPILPRNRKLGNIETFTLTLSDGFYLFAGDRP